MKKMRVPILLQSSENATPDGWQDGTETLLAPENSKGLSKHKEAMPSMLWPMLELDEEKHPIRKES
jgi:hypothetical protein